MTANGGTRLLAAVLAALGLLAVASGLDAAAAWAALGWRTRAFAALAIGLGAVAALLGAIGALRRSPSDWFLRAAALVLAGLVVNQAAAIVLQSNPCNAPG
jgi:hypothetical protein